MTIFPEFPPPPNERSKQLSQQPTRPDTPTPTEPNPTEPNPTEPTEGEEFPETDTDTNSEYVDTQARLAAIDIAARVPHSSVDGLLTSAEKVYQYLTKGTVTESS